jgi:serine/threonine protein kinase/Tfp pilus assembly protein PilF
MLSRYRDFVKIGEGGMGVVYRAEDATLKRPVALKFLTSRLLAEDALRARFLREARLDASLNHPNICTVYEFSEVQAGEEDSLGDGTRLPAGTPFMAMELVGGKTLQAHLRESGPLSPAAVRSISDQLAGAIAAAHESGIIHRDLKPGNVMLTETGSVKVLDFGLAKSLALTSRVGPDDETLTADLTREGQLLGTTAYMSPEQARGEQVDKRSDLFSLGTVLYEMATGENPFRGFSSASTLSKVLSDEPRPIAELRSDLSRQYQDAVHRCLKKNPDDRYQDAAELAGSLRPRRRSTSRLSGWLSGLVVASTLAAVMFLAWYSGWLRPGKLGSPELRSIAVLPCVTSTGDIQEDYFSEGITVDIITQLARIGSLRVISPMSTLQYKNASKSAAEIASELAVDSLLRCNAAQVADRIRISAQLIEPETDAVLWAESYNRSTEDILTVWSDVAIQIAAKLRTTLTTAEQDLLGHPQQINSEAYHAYQRGRLLWRTRKRENIDSAIAQFQEALTHDPGFAQAYAGLADAYSSLPRYVQGEIPYDEYVLFEREYGTKALEAANKALALNPKLAGPHATKGHQLRSWHMEEAEREFRMAIDLEPGYVWAHVWYGGLLSSMGRHAEAIAELETAVSLAPVTQVVNGELGWVYGYARDYERAIAQIRKTIAMDPSWSAGHFYLGDISLWARRYDLAREGYAAGLGVNNFDTTPLAMILGALLGEVPVDEAVPHVAAMEEYFGPMTVAELYAGLGESARSLDALERAYDVRASELPTRILREPLLDTIRAEPRYLELVENLGLTEHLNRRRNP